MRNRMFGFLLILFVCSPLMASKQNPINFNWDENRERLSLSAEEEELPALILQERKTYHYLYEENDLALYTLEHRIVRVNSDDAIQTFNKIFISMYNVVEIIDIKARSIATDGQIIKMDKDNIKEMKDENLGRAYKIFAIEGVENGSEIEYYVIKKMYPRHTGSEYYQYSTPIKNAVFELSCPMNLEFKFKGYNGFPEPVDSVIDNEFLHRVTKTNIEALEEEEYAMYNPNRQRLEYKLASNLNFSSKELYTFEDVGENFFKGIYSLSKKETKSMKKAFKNAMVRLDTSNEEKVKQIERYIKTSYHIQEGYQDELSQLDFIIKNHYGDKYGIVKLYTAFFDMAGINHQIVLTSKRDNIKFDGSFETYRFLNNYLLYIEDEDMYLTPTEMEFRYPMIPDMLTYTDALFIKPIRIGEYNSALTEVKFIPAPDFTQSFNNLDIDLAFNSTMDKLNVKIKKSLGGYDAMFLHPYYAFMEQDVRDQFLRAVMQSYASDGEFSKLEVENTDPNISPMEKPLIINAELTSSALFEMAGDKILLKIGDIIGPQVEMYQEKERKLPVENDYNRMYDRVISFHIPDGYTIKNPEDIIIDLYYEKEGETIFCFRSMYELIGQYLSVEIIEFYKEIECPVQHFEEYRKVINAAADFNKITLVLEPQN